MAKVCGKHTYTLQVIRLLKSDRGVSEMSVKLKISQGWMGGRMVLAAFQTWLSFLKITLASIMGKKKLPAKSTQKMNLMYWHTPTSFAQFLNKRVSLGWHLHFLCDGKGGELYRDLNTRFVTTRTILIELGHRRVTRSNARLGRAKMATARRHSVICAVACTPKPRFPSRLSLWRHLRNTLWEWSIGLRKSASQ